MEKYLDKEDIEELGWKYMNGFFYEWSIKNEIEIPELSNRALDFRLNFVSHNHSLHITVYERNSFEWETVYNLPCKYKSELMELMKKLNIKKI